MPKLGGTMAGKPSLTKTVTIDVGKNSDRKIVGGELKRKRGRP
jgi:hypothetical protein